MVIVSLVVPWPWTLTETASWSYYQPAGVHFGTVNALFCDGHVQSFPRNDLIIVQGAPRANFEALRRWNSDNRP